MKTIAITGQLETARLLHALLVDHGFHPQPIQPDMQVTHTGGEMGYSITVPAPEAEGAACAVTDAGLGRWLL